MNILAAIIVAAVCLFIGTLVIRAVRHGYYAMSGALKPLPRKDNNRDNPNRGMFWAKTDLSELNRASFSAIVSDICPLHELPYLGYTRFSITEPTSLDPSGRVDFGSLYVIGCAKCFDEARKSQNLLWERQNQADHPIWASAQIYPILTGGRQLKIEEVFIAFDQPEAQMLAEKWIASSDLRARANGIVALSFLKNEKNIALLKPLLLDEAKVDNPFVAKTKVCEYASGVMSGRWGLNLKNL